MTKHLLSLALLASSRRGRLVMIDEPAVRYHPTSKRYWFVLSAFTHSTVMLSMLTVIVPLAFTVTFMW
jgi:hypothetical protein